MACGSFRHTHLAEAELVGSSVKSLGRDGLANKRHVTWGCGGGTEGYGINTLIHTAVGPGGGGIRRGMS